MTVWLRLICRSSQTLLGFVMIVEVFKGAVPSSGFGNGESCSNLMDGSCLWWVTFLRVFNALECGEDN
jgi:hypothetical protein